MALHTNIAVETASLNSFYAEGAVTA